MSPSPISFLFNKEYQLKFPFEEERSFSILPQPETENEFIIAIKRTITSLCLMPLTKSIEIPSRPGYRVFCLCCTESTKSLFRDRFIELIMSNTGIKISQSLFSDKIYAGQNEIELYTLKNISSAYCMGKRFDMIIRTVPVGINKQYDEIINQLKPYLV